MGSSGASVEEPSTSGSITGFPKSIDAFPGTDCPVSGSICISAGSGIIPDLISYKNEVTVNHLLHHFSGLGDYEYSDYPGRFINAVGEEFRWGNEDYMSNEEIYALFKTLPLIMRPETKFWYSNLGYGLLAIIVENTTGMSLREYAESKILSEKALLSKSQNSNDLSIGILRYFNPAGADTSGFIGDNPNLK